MPQGLSDCALACPTFFKLTARRRKVWEKASKGEYRARGRCDWRELSQWTFCIIEPVSAEICIEKHLKRTQALHNEIFRFADGFRSAEPTVTPILSKLGKKLKLRWHLNVPYCIKAPVEIGQAMTSTTSLTILVDSMENQSSYCKNYPISTEIMLKSNVFLGYKLW